MNCLNCENKTTNPKFCSQSCAAQFNNRAHPKRQKQGRCLKCQTPINTSLKYCGNECKNAVLLERENERKKNEKFRKCAICKRLKTADNSFTNKETGKEYSYCKKCASKRVTLKNREFKQECVNYLGGKCELCGYSKCIGAIDFHHRNPKEKDFSIAQHRIRCLNDTIKSELDKCMILCSNCHREEHYKMTEHTNEMLQ